MRSAAGGYGAPPQIVFRGARPSRLVRIEGRSRRVMMLPTPVQHVVVIIMENRTVDDLLSGYYEWRACGTNHSTKCGSALNLYDPLAEPTLQPNSLSAHFDPDHAHGTGWWHESQGAWGDEPLHCKRKCKPTDTPLSYVPTSETEVYRQIIEHWEFASNVLQANQGPSFAAHQYFIAGQSGGLAGAKSAPFAEAENPRRNGDDDDGIDPEAVPGSQKSSGCVPRGGYNVKTVNMAIPAPSEQPWDNGPSIYPCEEYNTILDEIESALGKPVSADWQYIAQATRSAWAAPLGVEHLFKKFKHGGKPRPFTVDPDAVNFVNDIAAKNPSRPFAALTYITPCTHSSDHPRISGNDDGPEWLGWLVNAIGESKYWRSTAIFVVWDDWGGFYDHVPPVPPSGPGPYRPLPNPYNNVADPNEWGFRVPLMVISPYVTARGYISNQKTSGFQYRSQSAILQFVEGVFGLPSLRGDDIQQNQADGFADMFDMGEAPLSYVKLRLPPSWHPPHGRCPT